jgi:antitoxin FitA
MASITIRNLDDRVKEQLRVAAARSGHSMEEHVRQLIEREVDTTLRATGFGTWMHEQFRGIDTSDFEVPARRTAAEPPSLPR